MMPVSPFPKDRRPKAPPLDGPVIERPDGDPPGESVDAPLPPREQRALGRMDDRYEVEKLSWGRSQLKVTAVWGSYTYDALFRLGLGLMLGSLAVRVADSGDDFLFPGTAADGLRLTLLWLPPILLLIVLGFRWRRRAVVRPHLVKLGLLLGAANALLATFVTLP